MAMSVLARNKVYDRLREDIIAGRLPPGADLREAKLAQEFQVSKSPVRDALHRLEMERLICVRPRRGYRVAPVSAEDARELLDVRVAIEQACVTRAARQASDAELAELDGFRHGPAGGATHFVAYNRAFHLAVAQLSGNRRMADYSRELCDQYDRLVQVSISMTASRDYSRIVAEHGRIVDALQARDARRAARLVGVHIRSAEKRIVAGLARLA